jgi:hypothetical protein
MSLGMRLHTVRIATPSAVRMRRVRVPGYPEQRSPPCGSCKSPNHIGRPRDHRPNGGRGIWYREAMREFTPRILRRGSQGGDRQRRARPRHRRDCYACGKPAGVTSLAERPRVTALACAQDCNVAGRRITVCRKQRPKRRIVGIVHRNRKPDSSAPQNVAMGFAGEPVPPRMGSGAAVSRKSQRLRAAAAAASASRSQLSKRCTPR